MKNNESRFFRVGLDMLGAEVFCLVGLDFPSHNRKFLSLAESDGDMSEMAKLMAEVQQRAMVSLSSESTSGVTIWDCNAPKCIQFIVLKEMDMGVLVHELVHVVENIMDYFGLEDGHRHELRAKCMEYLFNKLHGYFE